MKYMGSKDKYAKYLLPYILADRKPNQYYVELFCGGMNMIDKVSGNRLASDINPYLISMWKHLQIGWLPPESISRDQYNEARDCFNKKSNIIPDYLIGYIGFNGSYGGRFFDGGYAGISNTKEGKSRNYPLEAYKNIIKQIPKIKDIDIKCGSYTDIELPEKSILYLDKPYQSTKKYNVEEFNHEVFWDWCRIKKQEGHQLFISEYSAPYDFKCIVSLNAKSSLSSNGTIGGSKTSIEKLFTL